MYDSIFSEYFTLYLIQKENNKVKSVFLKHIFKPQMVKRMHQNHSQVVLYLKKSWGARPQTPLVKPASRAAANLTLFATLTSWQVCQW